MPHAMSTGRWIALLLSAALVATPGVRAATAASSPDPAAADDAITVTADQRLAKGCRPWTPRGLSFFGRLVPQGWQTDPGTMRAQQAFSSWTVDAVKWMGGDTIRLQIGLPFLDPQSPEATPGYLDEVREAVRMARRAGLVVILSMQWEGRTHVKPVEMIPGASTLRAWRVVGPAFADDPGILFELFNEPASPSAPGPGFWRAWHDGHQAVIDALRALGARNVLVVDGLNGARTFDGAPALQDPLGRLAYGLHPYLAADMAAPADFDRRFGRFAASHAMIATEWSHEVRACGAADGEAAARLLDYLDARRIGLVGYGADEAAGRLLRTGGGTDFRATTFDGHRCEDHDAGPGELVRRSFARAAAADARESPLPRAVCTAR
jgi:hypothetical protein